MSQKIRIKLKSYDYSLVDKSAEKIVKTVKATGAVVSGPIPLPTHKRIFTVNRSTFVNKKSRDQFELASFKRLIDIHSSTAKTVDALLKLELPSGVEVEIKVYLIKQQRNARIIREKNRDAVRFQCRGKKYSMHCYRSRSVRGYSGKNRLQRRLRCHSARVC